MMKLTLTSSVLVIAGAALAGGLAFAQAPDAPSPAVSVARATNECFTDLVYLTGTLVPREEIVLLPEVEGARISELPVNEGDRVKPGQILAKMVRAEGGGRSSNVDLTSPIEGVVVKRGQGARLGAMASAQSPEPLFRIARGGEVEVDADIPENRMTKVAVGQTARIQVSGVGEFSGKVRLVAPEIERQTRLGRVKIPIGNDNRLRFGATVTGTIETAQSCGVSVPVTALLIRPDGAFVQRVQNRRVETRRVSLGLVDGTRAEIREGIGEGDLVVARAGSFLREGDIVRPIAASDQAGARK